MPSARVWSHSPRVPSTSASLAASMEDRCRGASLPLLLFSSSPSYPPAVPPLAIASGPIKTLVVLIMENCSFDHMLGWMKRLNPEINGVTGVEWNPVSMSDPASERSVAIFFLCSCLSCDVALVDDLLSVNAPAFLFRSHKKMVKVVIVLSSSEGVKGTIFYFSQEGDGEKPLYFYTIFYSNVQQL
ncbi:non-specific phospholipase C2-like [Canna indica]|uniref:Non-specific phospholipase C2-like n=1 Tax=Canna indica TaxID=4628 RepID=A0AAQ3K9Y3_9LILI|nr:non-specific phospholipase C2-like [Canna indica]